MRALRDFVLAPAGELAAPAAAAGPAGPAAVRAAAPAVGSLAVLCAAGDARAAGVGAGVLLARRSRAPCALACIWTAPEAHRHPDARPPTGRAARRLAGALGARGLDALACGRVAVVALPGDPADAAPAAARAFAAAGEAPGVLVLGGPRDDAFDALLADCDAIALLARTDRDAAVAELAVAGLGTLAAPAAARALALGPAARAMAAAGVLVPGALRRALAPAVDGAL